VRCICPPSCLAFAQVIDARNPLLFRCPDVETYTHEHAGKKENLLILNKADFLTAEMRVLWRRYFRKLGVMVREEGERGRGAEATGRARERE
jgi:ribosome biogenesis GTPase A